MNKTVIYLLSTIFLLLSTSCVLLRTKEVIITKDYVTNPEWSETNNSLRIYKMRLKNGPGVNPEKTSPDELLKRFETDTSFASSANVIYNGEKYSQRKVYYNQENNFLWYRLTFDSKVIDTENGRNIIGELERDNWYKLSGLSSVKTLYYVYINPDGKSTVFEVSASYWTNY